MNTDDTEDLDNYYNAEHTFNAAGCRVGCLFLILSALTFSTFFYYVIQAIRYFCGDPNP